MKCFDIVIVAFFFINLYVYYDLTALFLIIKIVIQTTYTGWILIRRNHIIKCKHLILHHWIWSRKKTLIKIAKITQIQTLLKYGKDISTKRNWTVSVTMHITFFYNIMYAQSFWTSRELFSFRLNIERFLTFWTPRRRFSWTPITCVHVYVWMCASAHLC